MCRAKNARRNFCDALHSLGIFTLMPANIVYCWFKWVPQISSAANAFTVAQVLSILDDCSGIDSLDHIISIATISGTLKQSRARIWPKNQLRCGAESKKQHSIGAKGGNMNIAQQLPMWNHHKLCSCCVAVWRVHAIVAVSGYFDCRFMM